MIRHKHEDASKLEFYLPIRVVYFVILLKLPSEGATSRIAERAIRFEVRLTIRPAGMASLEGLDFGALGMEI